MTCPARLLALVLVALALGVPRTVRADDDVVSPATFDPSTCVRSAPLVAPTTTASPPVTWSGFEIKGTLTDAESTLRAVFEPTMRRHRAMTDDARSDVSMIAGSFGYHLIGLGTRDTPQGKLAVIQLSPLPMVRRIEVDVKQGIVDVFTTPLFEDEIKRRIRARVGSYLPWAPNDRACQRHDEQRRIEDYLRDEGYFEAKVTVTHAKSGHAVTIKVKASLGTKYESGRINVGPHDNIPNLTDNDIRALFRHQNCIVKLCYGIKRFTRADHLADIQRLVETLHIKGYPAARVRTDFDPLTSFDRRTKKVNFTITIDTRRKLDVVFEGYDDDVLAEKDLRKQLTFDDAASADAVEAGESAKALTAYLQQRGYFDARVTWNREPLDWYDRITFRIELGEQRLITAVSFVGNKELTEEQLREVIGTRESRFSSKLFGRRTRATSAQLAADVDAIVNFYAREGYRDARVRVDAATNPAALGSAALTAAMLGADRGQDLHVRFTITEGQPTVLIQIHVAMGDQEDAITTPEQKLLCTEALAELAALYVEPSLAKPVNDARCVAMAPSLRFKEGTALDARDQLKDRLFSHGRPRAKVVYETRMIGPRRVAAFYRVTDWQRLTIGKVIIRGNFRTDDAIIRQLLRLDEGKPLTKDALADGARRLRNSGLFDAVNVAMPDLENISEGSVNAVVEIAERYDYWAHLEIETGFSSYNGTFITLAPGFKNLFGVGMSLDLRGTLGFDLGAALEGELKFKQVAAEGTLKLPQWLSQRWFGVPESLAFQTELTGFHRRQDTPRFGIITTDGVTLSLLRTWSWQRVGTRPAHAITLGPHYDFRLRERPVDVHRPIGADDDQTQVPISTRTGSIGLSFEWEHRNDRRGTLSPLAPEKGFRLDGQISYAFVLPYFPGGQDTFIKVSAAGTKYWPIGSNLVLRTDLRYDQGFPLGGAVLLPEVERFFAGGDSTVRGYEDDRLATEILQMGVPPLGNLSQIRILPAGGNIRVMSSIDAELRIWKLFATGAFIDAGVITNQWTTVTADDIRPSVGLALMRLVTPFGALAIERAVPLRPQLGDNPRGRFHVSFAARAQF
ncbi:MAG: BamA/TamA family outer membrane protein [Deltaproteobacteria bacterium]|nr:BamA/TamA family outer membrane protein [Deltaproteobacteria bacterium]